MLSWILYAIPTGQCAGHKGGPITCECSTAQCAEQKTSVCTTEGLCFTQYLDRGSGTPSLLRGCTEGRTPILCENRKPSRAKNWPVLHCCDVDFCNRDAMPTPPDKIPESFNNLNTAIKVTNSSVNEPYQDTLPSSHLSSIQRNPWAQIVSPVYVSVLVLGVVSLIFIGIVAAIVIRRSNRFYADHYGALEFQVGKADVRCDCDSEMDSLGSSQHYLHMVYPNRST